MIFGPYLSPNNTTFLFLLGKGGETLLEKRYGWFFQCLSEGGGGCSVWNARGGRVLLAGTNSKRGEGLIGGTNNKRGGVLLA